MSYRFTTILCLCWVPPVPNVLRDCAMIVLREEGHAPLQNSVGSGANGSPASVPLTFRPEALTPGPR